MIQLTAGCLVVLSCQLQLSSKTAAFFGRRSYSEVGSEVGREGSGEGFSKGWRSRRSFRSLFQKDLQDKMNALNGQAFSISRFLQERNF